MMEMNTDIDKIPFLRIDLSGLGDRVAYAMMLRGEELSEAIRDGVNQAAESIDIVSLAKDAAVVAIEKSVRENIDKFFKYGNGRYVIDEMISRSLELEEGKMND